MVIIFDLVGTLFSLHRVEAVFRAASVPAEILPFWFARLLHVSMASTLAGRYTPFLVAGESALRQVLTYRDLPHDVVPDAMKAMQTLDPWDDARSSLVALRDAGHTLVALSNAHPEMLASLLGGARFSDLFAAVLSSDEAWHCKPHPAPYRMALTRMGAQPLGACMVAAHAWDIQGAAALGLWTVWISRVEKAWSFPGSPPGLAIPSLDELPSAIASLL